MTDTALVLHKESAIESYQDTALSVESVRRQIQVIQQVMAEAMKDGEHYGTIPGCGAKKTLFKSGSEKLCLTFRLRPEYQISRTDMPNYHREYEVVTNIFHITTGENLGQGVGNCSTMESKYRFRLMGRVCPKCGVEAIIKGKTEYGGGWVCLTNKGGCGQKFKAGDKAIEEQIVGRTEYDNPADYYNTVMKMAKKRSLVDGIIQALAASDCFAQDLEDEVNQEHRKVEEELKGKGGVKNQEKFQDWLSSMHSFTDVLSLKSWKAANEAKIKDDLSGQGELFAFNAKYAEHLAELEQAAKKKEEVKVKPMADYQAEIAAISSADELNKYWQKVAANDKLEGERLAQFKELWVVRKKAVIEEESQPPATVTAPAAESAAPMSDDKKKMLAAASFAGESVVKQALKACDLGDVALETLPDHLCKMMVQEMNAIVDRGEA